MRAKGFDKDVDVSTICQTAGISRKTGYQWAERYVKSPEDPDGQLSQKLGRVEAEHEALKKLYDDVCVLKTKAASWPGISMVSMRGSD